MHRAGSQSRRDRAWRLLEREWELAAIERGIVAAAAGTGAVMFIDGEPGSGKTELLRASEDLAVRSGLRVLGARASELERDFTFGLAIQLFEPLWLAAEPDQRSAWLSGSARRAGALFDGSITDATAETSRHYPIIHGLFWVTRHLREPLAILVDDVHWADGPSMRFLAYLAERVRQLPVAIVLTARQGDASVERKALASLRRAAGSGLLRTQPLRLEAVDTIVRRTFPEVDEAFSEACARVTGGNPFLLIELLNKLREEELSPQAVTAEKLAVVLPEKVVSAMAGRLDAMQPPVRALAQAVAVLGHAPSVAQAAAVAEVDSTEATGAADALAALGLLRSGVPLSFAHRLLREAVLATLSPLERAHFHARAATALVAESAGAERIAPHLLEAPPGHDQTATATLREAAEIALRSDRPDRAAELLDRALAEPSSGELRADVVLVRTDLLCDQGRYAEAAALLGDELTLRPGDQESAGELDAAYVSASSLVPGDHGSSRAVRERMIASLPAAPGPRQRRALARGLLYESLAGAPRADVRRLAELAWADGELLTDHPDGRLGWPLLSAALLLVDELERVVELSDAVLQAPIAGAGQVPEAPIRVCRAWALAEQGQLAQAIEDASAALAESAGQRPGYTSIALATVALCHLERGELEQADAALDRLANSSLPEPIRLPILLELRARLRLAQHRPEEALIDVSRATEGLRSAFGAVSPAALPSRSTAALAHLALGQADKARPLAEEELVEAQRVGTTRVVIRALRVLGLATGGHDGIELLSQAVELGAASPRRLEYIHALVDLGAALRRTNRRSDAREPLRRGLELAEQGDAHVLARRARTELLATSPRPELLSLSGPESLTASQRRVAELAAGGLSTREIAEALFVKPKTVEFHLRQIYRKLDVGSRDELASALHTELSDE